MLKVLVMEVGEAIDSGEKAPEKGLESGGEAVSLLVIIV